MAELLITFHDEARYHKPGIVFSSAPPVPRT
jgi:hypothetical protein